MADVIVDMIPAEEGDCFLITVNTEIKTNILVDGGYKRTYHKFLKPKLKQMKENGEKLDLVIVTHIDADHIEGIIELLRENGSSEKANIIEISEIWHNSYRHLQFDKSTDRNIDFREKAILMDKIAKGYNSNDDDAENKEVSAEDGSTLASLIYSGNYNWNTAFNGKAVCIEGSGEAFNINSELKLRLLSPNHNSLRKLSAFWLKELRKDKYDFQLTDEKLFDDAFEFFMLNKRDLDDSEENINVSSKQDLNNIEELSGKKEVSDTSPVNGSSITFILEFNDKKILFLADSHTQPIYIEISKLVENNYIPFFNAIKVSHHGSSRNTSRELLGLIDSYNFLFSTNGKKHNHPSPETIAKILNRKGDFRKLIFNYDLEQIAFLKSEKIQQEYNYAIESNFQEESITIKI